jgi:hypothetical protein
LLISHSAPTDDVEDAIVLQLKAMRSRLGASVHDLPIVDINLQTHRSAERALLDKQHIGAYQVPALLVVRVKRVGDDIEPVSSLAQYPHLGEDYSRACARALVAATKAQLDDPNVGFVVVGSHPHVRNDAAEAALSSIRDEQRQLRDLAHATHKRMQERGVASSRLVTRLVPASDASVFMHHLGVASEQLPFAGIAATNERDVPAVLLARVDHANDAEAEDAAETLARRWSEALSSGVATHATTNDDVASGHQATSGHVTSSAHGATSNRSTHPSQAHAVTPRAVASPVAVKRVAVVPRASRAPRPAPSPGVRADGLPAVCVVLRADNGSWLAADAAGKSAPLTLVNQPSLFRLIDWSGVRLHGGDKISLYTAANLYVSVPRDERKEAVATHPARGPEDTVVLVKLDGDPNGELHDGDRIALRAANGRYLTAAGAHVQPSAAEAGAAQTFTLEFR